MQKIAQAMVLSVVGITPIVANADTAEIRANLLFDGGSDEANGLIDDFHKTLATMDGQVIWLELSLLNKEGEAGNKYSVTLDTDDEVSSDILSKTVVCGGSDGQLGLIDNMNYGYVLGFNRPADFHGPTTIHIGDRRNYPRHSIKCSAENANSENETALQIRGHFVVEVSEILAARVYDLIPISGGR